MQRLLPVQMMRLRLIGRPIRYRRYAIDGEEPPGDQLGEDRRRRRGNDREHPKMGYSLWGAAL